jgi:hypothetical protein
MNSGIVVHAGRPELTKFELESTIRKLAPFLQRGLSVKAACLQTGIPASTIYKKMQEFEWFRMEIERTQQFVPVAYSDVIFREFMRIYAKVQNQTELTQEEYNFIFWMGEHDKTLADMFGKTTEVTRKEDLPVIPTYLQQPKNLKALLEMLEIIKQRGGLEEDEEKLEESNNNQKQIDGETYNAL